MATRIFRRRPRLSGPPLPNGELKVAAPPEQPRTVPGSVVSYALPAVMILTSVGFVAVGGVNTASMMLGGMMLMSTVGMMGGGMGNRRGARRAQLRADRNDYLAYLDHTRAQIATARTEQRANLVWKYPDPTSLWSIPGGRRMWERRPSDPDFTDIRLGVGSQRLARKLEAASVGPIAEVDPIGVVALHHLVHANALIDDLPIGMVLRSFPVVSVDGELDAARGLVRSIVSGLAMFHGPDHLAIAAVVGGSARSDWDWLKWLPHNQHPRLTDGLGSLRMVASSLAEVETWLGPELGQRPRHSRNSKPEASGAGSAGSVGGLTGVHVVIIVDGGHVNLDEKIVAEGGLAGVTVIDLSRAFARVAVGRTLRLQVDNELVSAMGTSETFEVLGKADALTVAEADAFARRLAPYRISDAAAADAEPLARSAELVDMLGVGNPANLSVDRLWRPRAAHDRLRIPIGLGEQGEPVELDVKEAAQGGMGPHGLVIGATGSGKSELLRTLVLGLAITHAPSALNFILVDFKGGATFLGLQDLPHTAAVITNLADDLTMVDRMHDAISGEMNRRQQLLKNAGNVANVSDYERAREQGAPLEPLPSLLIICDEFTEMLTQKPEFTELFVAIGRLGRSLSMHLLLASQRLEQGRLRGLDSHLSYRIGLKTFSASESREVLGVPDAYELPSSPGSGFLKHDVSTLVRFKAAYVSGSYQGDAQVGPALGGAVQARPCSFVASRVDLEPEPAPVASPTPPEPTPAPELPGWVETDSAHPANSVLDVVVSRLRGQGVPAHEVWLPPLKQPPSLDQLLPPLSVVDGRGLCPDGWSGLGSLRVPLGVVDLPYDQRREPLWVDFAGAAGHGVVVGGPQSGKSTALRDIVTSLALTHTPEEVQIYCVDLGGGSLATTRALPHVGAVASRSQPDLVRRLVAEVTGVLAEREAYFRAHGIESMAAYRRARREGRGAPGLAGRFGDVFLIVDGWGAFRSEFEELEARITSLAAQGLSFGIHVIISAARWQEVRAALKDMIGTRLELRLGDPAESEVDRKTAVNVPAGTPGRGTNASKKHILTALPRIDGSSDPTSLQAGFADLVEQVSSAWSGESAPPVRMLPETLPYRQLSAPTGTRQIPIGINEDALAPVMIDFDADPHVVYFADAESGKTNFLKVVAAGLMTQYQPSEVRILLADYRRSMLGVIGEEYLAGYAAGAQGLEALLRDVRPILTSRLPGPDVTAEQLANRSWWSGPELFVMVDDYDLVAAPSGNPIAALLEFLPQAKDVGLHLIIARRSGGAARALYEPVIQRLREVGTVGFVGSGSRDEGALLGTARPSALPPGRGVFVSRRGEQQLVQIAKI